MKSARAKEVAKLTPAELRNIISAMRDDELENLMLYFKLGLLSFLEELQRQEREIRRVEMTL